MNPGSVKLGNLTNVMSWVIYNMFLNCANSSRSLYRVIFFRARCPSLMKCAFTSASIFENLLPVYVTDFGYLKRAWWLCKTGRSIYPGTSLLCIKNFADIYLIIMMLPIFSLTYAEIEEPVFTKNNDHLIHDLLIIINWPQFRDTKHPESKLYTYILCTLENAIILLVCSVCKIREKAIRNCVYEQ